MLWAAQGFGWHLPLFADQHLDLLATGQKIVFAVEFLVRREQFKKVYRAFAKVPDLGGL